MPDVPYFRIRENSSDVLADLQPGILGTTFLHNGGGSEHAAVLESSIHANMRIRPYSHFEDWVHPFKAGVPHYALGECFHRSSTELLLPRFVSSASTHADGYLLADADTGSVPIPEWIYRQLTFGPVFAHIWEESAVPESVVKDLAIEAFNYFSDAFPPEFSASEFTQGLFQLQSLLPEIGDSILNTLSKGFLNEQFGWENLLSDLGSLSSVLADTSSRIAYLKKTYGKPTRLGFSRKNIFELGQPVSNYYLEDPVGTGHTGVSSGCRCILTGFDVSFRATAWITQTLDFLDGVVGWLRALAGWSGLNNPVKAFWQVIPFSFVVDWFLHVSNHLDHLTRINPGIGWDISAFTYSLKYKYEWKWTQVIDYGFPSDTDVNSQPWTVTQYQRFIGLPVDTGLLDLFNLSPHQLILLVALGLV